jgi:hypothetical protein
LLQNPQHGFIARTLWRKTVSRPTLAFLTPRRQTSEKNVQRLFSKQFFFSSDARRFDDHFRLQRILLD